ncbi:hypothetical protein TRICHSKD4_0548 [Roseibium sp. TrichSKD4]|nr:hypothetical protein TRICHSKD4_0548 [Roseibium sp. TrichSKD4]
MQDHRETIKVEKPTIMAERISVQHSIKAKKAHSNGNLMARAK